MWGEHRKEKEPNRMREKSEAQERETAKVRKRKEGKERQPSELQLWFQPSSLLLFLALPICTPPLISPLVLLLFLGMFVRSCLHCCCQSLSSLYQQFLPQCIDVQQKIFFPRNPPLLRFCISVLPFFQCHYHL